MQRHDTIRLRDGRALAYATWGDPAGLPLLRCHGAPGSRYGRSPDVDVYERVGACVVSFDRPGYGGSSPHRERTILSVADDALELVDALGWNRFSVVGRSAGGPYALALGLRAPERVTRIGLVAASVPREFIDPSELIDINREGARHADEGRRRLEEFMAGPATQLAADPAGAFNTFMKDAPASDRAFLEEPHVRALLIDELREAFRSGPEGWFDDAWTAMQPWGFDLTEVRTPVWIWHGETDRNAPLSAMRRLAQHLRVVSFTELRGQGHLSAMALEETILRALLT